MLSGAANEGMVLGISMQANPQVTVQLGKEQFEAIAEDIPEEERAEVWKKIIKINHHQGEYLEKVERKIPLVWFRKL